MAAAVIAQQIRQAEEESLEQLLQEVGELTEEEALSLLAEGAESA
jgi:hypothetical protein